MEFGGKEDIPESCSESWSNRPVDMKTVKGWSKGLSALLTRSGSFQDIEKLGSFG